MMSDQAKRLRRVGKSRAMVRHDLRLRDAVLDAQRFGVARVSR